MTLLRYLLTLAAATYSLTAAPIYFSSNSTAADSSETNSIGSNVIIQKNSGWANPIAGSQWVSYANTGDPNSANFVSPANGTVVKFYQNFTLASVDPTKDGTISLYADDSSSVILNGITLLSEASSTNNHYSTCSDTKPNCTVLDTILLPYQDLKVGVNTLEFDVAQRAGSSFGLDYSGSVGAPEPGTWAMMVTGVLLVAVGTRRYSGSALRG